MKVLVNAYACSPNMGSEPGMAWNWCVNLAKYCELFIITEEEFRSKIEAVVPTLPQGKNMHFYFNPVTPEVRKMCWNQGNWRFYWYYRKWQKRSLDIAKNICAKEDIDIIHQLNMMGFREPGLLWKITGPKFVWGPIGAVETIPLAFLKGAGIKPALLNAIKKAITNIQFRYQGTVREAMKRADAIVASSVGCQRMIEDYYHKKAYQINENGCEVIVTENKVPKIDEQFDIIWCGKFIFHKRFDLALKTIALLKDLKVKLHVVGIGDGSEYKKLEKDLKIEDHVEWHWVGHEMVNSLMRQADVLLFTSVYDATSRTVMEAIQNQTPVICFDAYGFGTVVDETIGIKVPFSNPEQAVQDFAAAIRSLYYDRGWLSDLSANCKERIKMFTWEHEAEQMVDIYNRLLA